MANIPVQITDEQRANLAKLAAYLRTLPADYPDFEMDSFVRSEEFSARTFAHVATCGTAACAVGHGPMAGIMPTRRETWVQYSVRAFLSDDMNMNGAWQFCFGQSWSDIDNTVHGAADRIDHVLRFGVPDNAYDQQLGYADLTYGKHAVKA